LRIEKVQSRIITYTAILNRNSSFQLVSKVTLSLYTVSVALLRATLASDRRISSIVSAEEDPGAFRTSTLLFRRARSFAATMLKLVKEARMVKKRTTNMVGNSRR